jgi:hypothetical protein
MIYFRLEVLTIYKHFRVNKDVIDDAIDNACDNGSEIKDLDNGPRRQNVVAIIGGESEILANFQDSLGKSENKFTEQAGYNVFSFRTSIFCK